MSKRPISTYPYGLGLTVLTIFALFDVPSWASRVVALTGEGRMLPSVGLVSYPHRIMDRRCPRIII